MAIREGPEATIGERIRWHRERAGKSQAVLAGLVGRTANWLSKVERDEIPVDRLSVLIEIARALRIRDIADLTGRSFSQAPDGAPEHDTIASIRAALATPPSILVEQASGEPLSITLLEARVDEAWSRYEVETHRYTTLGPELPTLLADAVHTVRAQEERQSRRVALRILSSVYGLIRIFTYRLGEKDLAGIAADRALSAAEETEDLAVIVDASRNVFAAMASATTVEQSLELSLRAIEHARSYMANDPTEYARATFGSMHLTAVISAARVGQEARAWHLLHEADRVARTLGPTANHTRTFFNTTNVAMHAVHLHVECGEADDAARVGRQLVLPDRVPLERVIRFGVEEMQAARLTRDWDTALAKLEHINRRSPEEMRTHVLIGETVRDLMKHAPTGKVRDVDRLARAAGIL
jgi:transcriptional regulator with XRE-family HTH domain